jgi:hypothetical protein
MSEPITVTVTSLSPDTVKVDGSSSQTVEILNGGAVNVAVGTVSPGNATIVSGTLTINSTTTLAAGSQAYVKNDAGTAYAAKLDIGIPAGPATLVSVGNTTTLAAGSSATVNGTTSGGNLTLAFSIPRGVDGTNGITPTFSASATTLSAGSSATVTATTSNSGANVALAFGIPQGVAGSGGSNLTLSDATPSALGTAAAGTSGTASRSDHTHTLPVIAYGNLSGVPANFPTNTALVSGLSAGYSGIGHAHNYVTSLNNLTGGLTLAAGSNVTLTANGSTLMLSSSAGGLGANDAVDGGDYVGEILYGITFGTQPQSQTLSSTTGVNLTTITPTFSDNQVSSFMFGTASFSNLIFGTALRDNANNSRDVCLISSSDNGSTFGVANVVETIQLGQYFFDGDYYQLSPIASNGTRSLFSVGLNLYSSDSSTLSATAPIAGGGSPAWNGTRFALSKQSRVGLGNSLYAYRREIYSSSDGANWTLRYQSQQQNAGLSDNFDGSLPLQVVGGTFVLLNSVGSSTLVSTDGITWTVGSAASESLSAASNGSRLVAARGISEVKYTTNGTTWATASTPVAVNRVSYAAGQFWAFNLATSGTDVCWSTNGISWQLGTLPTSKTWGGAVSGGSNVALLYDRALTGQYNYQRPSVFVRATQTTAYASANLTVSASVSGGAAVSYQWQSSADAGTTWANVTNATSSTLSLTGLTTANSGTRYRAAASATGATTVTSQSATLTVTG